MTRVRSGGRGRVAADAPSEPERSGSGGPGWGTAPPPPLWGGPNLPRIFPEMSIVAPVLGRGVPGRGFKSDQHLGSLLEPPHAGHNSDPGGGELNLTEVN